MTQQPRTIAQAIEDRIMPIYENILAHAKLNRENIEILDERTQHIDTDSLAAFINDHQALQARVRSLEFEIAKLMNERDEARKDSTPEYVNSPFNDM